MSSSSFDSSVEVGSFLVFTQIADNRENPKSYHDGMFRGLEERRKMGTKGHITTVFSTFQHLWSWPIYYFKMIKWKFQLGVGYDSNLVLFQAKFLVDPGRGTRHFLPESNSEGMFNWLVSIPLLRKCFSPSLEICLDIKFAVQMKMA